MKVLTITFGGVLTFTSDQLRRSKAARIPVELSIVLRREGRQIPPEAALRWAWVVGVDLPRLFSTKQSLEELTFRPLPEAIKKRQKQERNASVPPDSTLLFLTALKLSAANPFIAPRRNELAVNSRIHMKHAAFVEPHFVGLMRKLRHRERVFLRKERVWHEVCAVHDAACKVAGRGESLSRRRVGEEMAKPVCFCGPLARSYLAWIKKRQRGTESVLEPKRVPFDVRAYWSLIAQAAATKGG